MTILITSDQFLQKRQGLCFIILLGCFVRFSHALAWYEHRSLQFPCTDEFGIAVSPTTHQPIVSLCFKCFWKLVDS